MIYVQQWCLLFVGIQAAIIGAVAGNWPVMIFGLLVVKVVAWTAHQVKKNDS